MLGEGGAPPEMDAVSRQGEGRPSPRNGELRRHEGGSRSATLPPSPGREMDAETAAKGGSWFLQKGKKYLRAARHREQLSMAKSQSLYSSSAARCWRLLSMVYVLCRIVGQWEPTQ